MSIAGFRRDRLAQAASGEPSRCRDSLPMFVWWRPYPCGRSWLMCFWELPFRQALPAGISERLAVSGTLCLLQACDYAQFRRRMFDSPDS
jgi:hypothetical protein